MAGLIPHTWSVPQRFKDRLGSQVGRQRAMVDQDHLLLVLHAPPDPDEPERRQGRLFWRAPDGTWKATTGGGVGALRAHLDGFGAAVDALEERVERATRAEEWFQAVRVAAPLRRTARHLLETLQEAREALPRDRELISLRDQAGDLARAAELLHELAREGLEFVVARRAEEQAAQGQQMLLASHRLNLLAAVFLPVGALAGVLGMNLRTGLEELHAPWLFLGATALALGAGWWIRRGLPDLERA